MTVTLVSFLFFFRGGGGGGAVCEGCLLTEETHHNLV